MPVVEVDPDELRELSGIDREDEALLEDLFALGLEFEGRTDDDGFELEFAPDRLDRLSVEGIARSLRYQHGEARGVYVPETNDPEWTIEVEDTPPDRPYVTGAVVRGLDLSAAAFDSLIQLQEKLHATMGRTRAKGAIGVHDLTMLKGATLEADDESGKSILYTSMDPDEESFVPLESDEELTPREVTERHHMGSQYADLVADMDRYPAIYDDIGLFSFPPVINGRRTEVTTDSRDLLVEMTGTDQWTLDRMLNIVCYALSARGGRIERVEVSYGEGSPGEHAGRRLERPELSVRHKSVSHDRVESILGVDLDTETVLDCLERAGLEATHDEGTYAVEIPPYRVDVLHPMDIVDDIGRAYGFNELEPRYPDVTTVGGRHERSRLEDAVRETLVGLGFEDLLNFYMTNEASNPGPTSSAAAGRSPSGRRTARRTPSCARGRCHRCVRCSRTTPTGPTPSISLRSVSRPPVTRHGTRASPSTAPSPRCSPRPTPPTRQPEPVCRRSHVPSTASWRRPRPSIPRSSTAGPRPSNSTANPPASSANSLPRCSSNTTWRCRLWPSSSDSTRCGDPATLEGPDQNRQTTVTRPSTLDTQPGNVHIARLNCYYCSGYVSRR